MASEQASMGREGPNVEAEVVGAVRRNHPPGPGLRWENVPLKHYKEEGTHFRSITRQVLFAEESGLTNEVRYFEIQPGGHSTFERHEHVHAVIILSGRGRVLVNEEIRDIEPFDLVSIPPMSWHQFHAADDASLGFLCLVPCDRDRPQRPTREQSAALQAHPVIGSFIRL